MTPTASGLTMPVEGSRVLFVTTYDVTDEQLGGASWVDRTLVAALAAAGHDVTLFAVTAAPADGGAAVPLEVAHHPWRAARTLGRMLLRGEPYQAAKLRWARGWASRRADLVREVARHDVVVSSQTPGLALCADAGVPVALHVAHNVDSVLAARHDPAFFAALHNAQKTGMLERTLLARARRVVTLSATDAERLSAWGIAAKPLRLVEPQPARRPARGSSPRLGFIGKASWPPNREALHVLTSDVLPEVRRNLPDAPPTLVVAGLGSEAYADHEGVAALGPIADVQAFYDLVDVVVVTRTGETTGVSVKLLEAISQGVPVIAPRQLLEDAGVTHGAIVADTPREAAEAIIALARDGAAGTPYAVTGGDDSRLSLESVARALGTSATAAVA